MENNPSNPSSESTINPKVRKLIIFWTRMLGWLIASCVIPIVTFSIRFGLFNKAAVKTDALGNVIETQSTSLNGWGIISCVIIGFTISAIIKEVVSAYPKYSFAKQCLVGFRKIVLPLSVGFFVCVFLSGVIHHVMFCLGVLALCNVVAIPLNPLPKWRYEKSGVEEYSSAVKVLTDFVKRNIPNSKKEGV